jgi:hypothetical protein
MQYCFKDFFHLPIFISISGIIYFYNLVFIAKMVFFALTNLKKGLKDNDYDNFVIFVSSLKYI